MKATKVVEALNQFIKEFGDCDVNIQCEFKGARSEQKCEDVLYGDNGGEKIILLISKEAMEADPLLRLPHLSAVPDAIQPPKDPN